MTRTRPKAIPSSRLEHRPAPAALVVAEDQIRPLPVEYRDKLPRVLRRLTELQRICLELHVGEDYSHGEIAELLGIDRSSAARACRQALARARSEASLL